MTKTYLALALLITVLAGNAYGEDEIYYCAGTGSTGFYFNPIEKKYNPAKFKTHRFKIKLNRAPKEIKIKGHEVSTLNGIYACGTAFLLSQFICNNVMYQFNFNELNGRFVLLMGFGYAFGDKDTISIEYGTCDKF